jgi:hypothetical protein
MSEKTSQFFFTVLGSNHFFYVLQLLLIFDKLKLG